MSVVGIQRLAWDLEHVDGLLGCFQTDPDNVLARYPVSAAEALAVQRLDAHWLLAAGVSPVALRNLMVIQGVAHKDMYTVGRGGEPHDGQTAR